VPRIEPMTS